MSFHATLDALSRARGPLLVSIYLPLHVGEAGRREDPLRLRALLDEARDHALEEGHDVRAIARVLAPGERLLKEDSVWQGGGRGLALFLGVEPFRMHRGQDPYEPFAIAKTRFALRPLLRSCDGEGRWFVLAFSRNAARLVDCQADHAREIPLGVDLAAFGGLAERAPLSVHSGGQASRYHGQADDANASKAELIRALRVVDEAVSRVTAQDDAPLFVAAVGFEARAYRELSRHPGIQEAILEGSPDGVDARRLRDATEAFAVEVFRAKQRDAIRRVLAQPRRANYETGAILAAAHAGRVATLLVREEPPLWGRFDPVAVSTVVRSHRAPADDDLLDLAVALVLSTGGEVHAVDSDALPGNSPMAALLRF